jgi:hypothetical protein
LRLRRLQAQAGDVLVLFVLFVLFVDETDVLNVPSLTTGRGCGLARGRICVW